MNDRMPQDVFIFYLKITTQFVNYEINQVFGPGGRAANPVCRL